MWLKAMKKPDAVLAFIAVIERERHDGADVDPLRVHRLGVSGVVPGTVLDGRGASQRERPVYVVLDSVGVVRRGV
jgi:hypothetical protein